MVACDWPVVFVSIGEFVHEVAAGWARENIEDSDLMNGGVKCRMILPDINH